MTLMTHACNIRSRRRWWVPMLGALGAIAPTAAHAADPAAARALFEEAKALVDQGAYEKACPKFEASLQMSVGIGTRFNLADCWEHIGRTASAWSEYLSAAAAAKSAGQPERERLARERAAALEPTLGRLIIEVKATDPDLEVSKDGVPFARPGWGSAMPTDPGVHKIEARDRDKHVWSVAVDVPKAKTITVTIPPLDDSLAGARRAEPSSSPPGPPSTAAPSAAGSPAPQASGWSSQGATPSSTLADSTRSDASSGGDSRRMAGYVVGGAGIVGLGVGVVLGVMTNQKDSQARDICAGYETSCSAQDAQQHASLLDEAKGFRTGAYIAAAIGGVALATGAVLVLTAPKGPSAGQGASVALVPTFGAGTMGGALAARW